MLSSQLPHSPMVLVGAFLVVQWLSLCSSTAGHAGLTPQKFCMPRDAVKEKKIFKEKNM